MRGLKSPYLYILFSAALFGIGTPLAKLLLKEIPPLAMAGLLYLGAFWGLSLYAWGAKSKPEQKAPALQKSDWPFLVGAIAAGGIVAPFALLTGLKLISGLSASLLLNLEGLATALFAVLLWGENSGKRLWLALFSMTLAGVFLTWDPQLGAFNLQGSLWLILATFSWGLDNNLTRHISGKDPIQITRIKGLAAGSFSLLLALGLGMRINLDISLLFALILGAFSIGVSLVFFIKALEKLGSFRVGAFFSLAPFIGALGSIFILREWLGWVLLPATIFMLLGVWLIISDQHSHEHTHPALEHEHIHSHDDRHHLHCHPQPGAQSHCHLHSHPELCHEHLHLPDLHHRHRHL